MSNNNGGPAFPVHCEDWKGTSEGMTLRDYFAAKAMQSYISAHIGGNEVEREFDRLVSKWAYETADAMLAAREGDKA